MNPGSEEARAAGCVCAVLDNGHGRHPYMGWNNDGTGNWSVRGDCPLHGFETPENVEEWCVWCKGRPLNDHDCRNFQHLTAENVEEPK